MAAFSLSARAGSSWSPLLETLCALGPRSSPRLRTPQPRVHIAQVSRTQHTEIQSGASSSFSRAFASAAAPIIAVGTLCLRFRRGTRYRRSATSLRPMLARRGSTTVSANSDAPSSHLDVWSFNLRTELQEKADGIDGWSRRREAVADFISNFRPALICTQEATEPMLRFLAGRLKDYAWAGTSRTPGRMDEMAGFLFDPSRLTLQKHSATWFGPAEVEPGKPSWDAAYPRTFEVAVFNVQGAGGAQGCLRVMNTHLDHEGVKARRLSAEMLAAEVRRAMGDVESACAQILCGDFNSPKGGGNAVYEVLMAKETGLLDSFRVAPPADVPPSTIHKFKGLQFEAMLGDGSVDLQGVGEDIDERHIDWILWRDGVDSSIGSTTQRGLVLRPVKCEVITSCLDNGRYPSDHFPVSVRFKLC